jgi:hypothetical protein
MRPLTPTHSPAGRGREDAVAMRPSPPWGEGARRAVEGILRGADLFVLIRPFACPGLITKIADSLSANNETGPRIGPWLFTRTRPASAKEHPGLSAQEVDQHRSGRGLVGSRPIR